ncbi:MAG: hypothetical protein PHF97_11070 [Bacteroidales bacterium]|nr:hypothetical protein [Bacteroidales bacterium]MDD4604331.1 hypothetical protein [Bacteroidales bacterium]
MKVLSFILSIYIFYMVSLPCVDDICHIDNPSSEQTAPQNQDSHSDHADACSPFCICSCCSVPVTVTPVTYVDPPFFTLVRSIVPVTFHFISFYSPFYWQPPKIS